MMNFDVVLTSNFNVRSTFKSNNFVNVDDHRNFDVEIAAWILSKYRFLLLCLKILALKSILNAFFKVPISDIVLKSSLLFDIRVHFSEDIQPVFEDIDLLSITTKFGTDITYGTDSKFTVKINEITMNKIYNHML